MTQVDRVECQTLPAALQNLPNGVSLRSSPWVDPEDIFAAFRKTEIDKSRAISPTAEITTSLEPIGFIPLYLSNLSKNG